MRMKFFLLGILFSCFLFKPVEVIASEKLLVYRSYAHEQAEDALAETLIEVKDLPDGGAMLDRRKQIGDEETHDEFTLDRDASVLRWTRTCEQQKTEFTSERKGNFFIVKGMLKGKKIDKKVKLDSRPLYIYPKYSLTKFVLSGMKKITFWTLRRDRMDRLLMQAKRKGEEDIVINGKKIRAVKVYYSITGKLREKHYYRYYYYRVSDGLFLKKEEPKEKIEILVKEED